MSDHVGVVPPGPRWWWCEQFWGRPSGGSPRNTGGESEGKVGADAGQSGSRLGGKNTLVNTGFQREEKM